MNHEYLRNVLGSPYVNEGAFNRLKAKGAQAMGAMRAMTGNQIQNPTETKLNSLWEGFISSLGRVMTDWKSNVSPMLGVDIKLDMTSKQTRRNLDLLSQLLTPPTQATRSPKKLTKEGIWDVAKRNMGLNRALSSNDPTNIINSYKNYVLSLFQSFMKDAVKSIGVPVQQIYKMLAKIQPRQRSWNIAGNMQKIVRQLQNLQGVQKSTINRVPPVLTSPRNIPPVISPSSNIPPVIPSPMVTPRPISQPVPPLAIPPQVPATVSTPPTPPTSKVSQPVPPAQPQPTVNQTTSSGSSRNDPSTPVSDGFEIPAQDMPYVILKALKILIDAVSSDYSRALGLFGVDPNSKDRIPIPTLSTSWDSGNTWGTMQEDYEDPETDGETPDSTTKKSDAEDAEDAIIHKEYPNEFLYNFWSRHHKFPAQPFSIQAISVHESPDIKDANGDVIGSVAVWWRGNSVFNKIYVVETKNNITSTPTLILSFSDHQVTPRVGAITPGNLNFFDLYKVLKKSNPKADLSSAPAPVRAEVDGLKDNVLRALYATTHRKVMEFSSKGKEEQKAAERAKKKEADASTTNPNVSTVDPVSVKKSPKEIVSEIPSALDAAKALIVLGHKEKMAFELVYKAIKAIGIDKATDEYVRAAQTEPKPIIPKSPAKSSGAQSIPPSTPKSSPQFKEGDVVEAGTAKFKIKSISPHNVIVRDEKGGEFAVPTEKWESWVTSGGIKLSTSNPVSKVAGTPPPSPPVSAGASGPDPTTNPSAPVSDAGKKQATVQADQPQDVGTLNIENGMLVWTVGQNVQKLNVSQVKSMLKQPTFNAAVKANPSVYKKFQTLTNKSKKQKTQEGIELINPFRAENLM